MFRAPLIVLLIPSLVLACAEPSEPPLTPHAAGESTAIAPPPPPPPSASAPPVVDAAPPTASPHDADDGDGVRRWVSWKGPTAGSVVATPTAWAIAPNTLGVTPGKPSFSSVMVRIAEVVSSNEQETILRENWGRFAVPAALVQPAQPAPGLKRGAVARCSFGGNSVVGRIEAVTPKQVTCAFLFMEKPRQEKLAPEQILPLDGTPRLGAPVLARFASDASAWYDGFVVASDGEKLWVSIDTQFGQGDPREGQSVHEFAASDVRVLDLKRLEVGAPCVAPDIGRVAPCKVKKVIAGGLGYSVAFEGGATRDVEFDRVTRPLE